VLLRKLDENTHAMIIVVIQTISSHVPLGFAVVSPILSEYRMVEGVGRLVNAPDF
jgi:hypothetical protein